ncbi:MAG: hypothetical protein HY592_05540 [Candidatus Omnitrophica bacterium]|nr:hypothetical protein [Candidatus Omnitrophota bacterium]
MFIAGGLIALGVGYLVLVMANKEKEGVKILGQAIGIFVILASILCIVCSVSKCAGKYAGKSGCSPAQAQQCPMTQKG